MDNPFAQEPEKKSDAAQAMPDGEVKPEAEKTEDSKDNKHVLAEAGMVEPVETSTPEAENPVSAKVEVEETQTLSTEEESVVKDEGEEELLIENDGNVFWLFQKVVWSVLKMVLVVGAIVLMAWIIWRPGKNPLDKVHQPLNREVGIGREQKVKEPKSSRAKEKKEEKQVPVEEVVEEKKEEVKTEVPTLSALPENYAYKAGLWANWIEDTRQVQNAHILSRSLYWTRKAEGFLRLTPNDILISDDLQVRADRIDSLIESLRGMLDESKGLMMTLNAELDSASNQSRASEAGMLDHDRLLSSSIEALDGDMAEEMLVEKSRLYQDFVAQNSKITAYHYTLNQVQSMIPLLRDIHDNLLSNRQVLIDNVQVVGFPADQFHRILTPAEWQSQ